MNNFDITQDQNNNNNNNFDENITINVSPNENIYDTPIYDYNEYDYQNIKYSNNSIFETPNIKKLEKQYNKNEYENFINNNIKNTKKFDPNYLFELFKSLKSHQLELKYLFNFKEKNKILNVSKLLGEYQNLYEEQILTKILYENIEKCIKNNDIISDNCKITFLLGSDTTTNYKINNFFGKREIINSGADGTINKSSNNTNILIKLNKSNGKRFYDELLHESIVGMVFLPKLNIPNFIKVYGAFNLCEPTNDDNFCKSYEFSEQNDKYHLIIEKLVDYKTLNIFLNECSKDDMIDVITQVFNAINILYKSFNLSHNDLHYNNIMVKKQNHTMYIDYLKKDVKFNYLVKIIDFGRSSFVYNDVVFGNPFLYIKTKTLYPCQLYDIFKFIMFSLSKVYNKKNNVYNLLVYYFAPFYIMHKILNRYGSHISNLEDDNIIENNLFNFTEKISNELNRIFKNKKITSYFDIYECYPELYNPNINMNHYYKIFKHYYHYRNDYLDE